VGGCWGLILGIIDSLRRFVGGYLAIIRILSRFYLKKDNCPRKNVSKVQKSTKFPNLVPKFLLSNGQIKDSRRIYLSIRIIADRSIDKHRFLSVQNPLLLVHMPKNMHNRPNFPHFCK